MKSSLNSTPQFHKQQLNSNQQSTLTIQNHFHNVHHRFYFPDLWHDELNAYNKNLHKESAAKWKWEMLYLSMLFSKWSLSKCRIYWSHQDEKEDYRYLTVGLQLHFFFGALSQSMDLCPAADKLFISFGHLFWKQYKKKILTVQLLADQEKQLIWKLSQS